MTGFPANASIPRLQKPQTRLRNLLLPLRCFFLSLFYRNFSVRFTSARSFSCHTIKAVYYYCLHQNHSYDHALELYETIKAMPETAKSKIPIRLYRSDQNALDNCRSDGNFLALHFSEINPSLTAGTREHSFYIENLSFQIRGTNKDIGRSNLQRKISTIPDAKTLATPPASGLITPGIFFIRARHFRSQGGNLPKAKYYFH